ncbi:MAG: L-seryl-tRNA(Sec) selenium transferase [Lachnospiraceae bacterium]
MENKQSWYRMIPKMDFILKQDEMQEAILLYGKQPVMEAVNVRLQAIRSEIPKMTEQSQLEEKLALLETEILEQLEKKSERNLKRVINGTGTILHTNLGRAPLSEEMLQRVFHVMSGYSNLEYNLDAGKRGERYSHFEKLLCKITGAEAAMAVNNNAGAVLLMLSAVASGKEMIVSRGEQVEIGGKFRIPDIIDQSGGIRVEVGTTNKTRISDYEEHINERTGVLLKVHTSNFKLIGFTESVEREELTELGHRYDIPVVEDLGSGILMDLSKFGLKKEPTVMESVMAGVDLVSFSGDKLLGGPQAGIIVGKKKWVDRCKKHPLTRALRIDKFTAAMLEEILSVYEDLDYAREHIPVLSMLTESVNVQHQKALRLVKLCDSLTDEYEISVVSCESQAGGGSLPGEQIASAGVRIWKEAMHAGEIEKRLRGQPVPLIVRIEREGILLDMRTIFEKEIPEAAEILKTVLG